MRICHKTRECIRGGLGSKEALIGLDVFMQEKVLLFETMAIVFSRNEDFYKQKMSLLITR